MRPTSFSQNNMFSKCPRAWFYSYVKKIPVVQDMCYAHAGSVLHKVMELYYNGIVTEIDKLKDKFNMQWKSYKLEASKIANKKDDYWGMVLNGIDLAIPLTSTELKIFYPDVVGYLDIVNTKDDEIRDWKSSTRRPENEKEYKKQLTFYSYLYRRKFNRLPKNTYVHYLKYIGNKGVLEYTPTTDDLIEIEDWHFNIRKQMETIRTENKVPPRCESCYMFCPYENLCMKKDEGVLKFTLHIIGNYIHLNGNITNIVNKQLERKYSYELKNAFFIKKAKPNANTTVRFWNLKDRKLPIGFMNQLVKTLSDYAKIKNLELVLDVDDKRVFNDATVKMPEKFVNGKTLRDYQDEAVIKFKRKKIAILEIGTGGGKTEISVEIIRQLGMKTLFVVDKIELLRQTKKRIEDCLGIEVGQIGAGVEDIKDVTVATIQTLSKHLTKYSSYLKTIRFVIFDECHKVAARSFWRLGHHLTNTEYRLGLSGTAFRDDGDDMYITAITGDKCFDLSSKFLIENGWLVRPTITFYKDYMEAKDIRLLESRSKEGLINETKNYSKYYENFIVDNDKRNNIIVCLTKKYKEKKVLVLTKLIRHGEMLNELIPNSEHLFGGTPKETRKKMFERFIKGETNVLISTISIFSEGIDIPDLDVIINAGANRGNVKTIQMLGRVLRILEGKKNALYFDFIDEDKFFRMASLARKRALYNQGHKVEVLKWEKENGEGQS